jgi:hypothetical protein
VLNLLRRAFSDRKRNVEAVALIYEGKPIEETLPKSIEKHNEVKLDPQWCLERFFHRHGLSFAQGVSIVYLIKIIPTLVAIIVLGSHFDISVLTQKCSTLVGDLFIPISLVMIHSIYKSWVSLIKTVNKNIKENRYVAPPVLLTENQLKSSKSLDVLDKSYSNRYIKPVMSTTLQSGLNLAFSGYYQLASGAISTGALLLLIFLGPVARILPFDFMFRPTGYGSFFLNAIEVGTCLWGWSIDWFIIGLLTWTLFLSFLCILQISGNPLRARPFEQIKKRFAPIFSLTLKVTLTVAIVVAWVSPFLFSYSLGGDTVGRQYPIYFLESVLSVTTPIIVLSFLFPAMRIHKALSETCDRLLLLKDHQLEDIKKLRESQPDEYMKIERHLILDYKDIQKNQVWFFDLEQALQLIGSVLLPLITFWLSIQLR